MSSDELILRLRVGRDRAVEGKVNDLALSEDGGSVEAAFDPSGTPILPIGEIVVFALSGSGLARPLEITGRVYSHFRDGDSHRYRFGFDSGPSELRPGINRRTAVRVRHDPREPVEVVLRTRDGSRKTCPTLNDLSTGGLSVLVTREQEEELSELGRLMIAIQLPGVAEVVEMAGIVRARRLTRETILYGIQFDTEATRDFVRKEECLLAYVLRRQTQTLHELRARRE